MNEKNHLLMFYGQECPHCETMKPFVEKIELDNHLTIERLEVWHDIANQQLMKEYDTEHCEGVPFFYNTRSKKSICGETDFQSLEDWAIGK
ncbi:MAG: thioredoxin family protein [Candidatus Paceibacterota bacterium]|jgi:hypothetical protein